MGHPLNQGDVELGPDAPLNCELISVYVCVYMCVGKNLFIYLCCVMFEVQRSFLAGLFCLVIVCRCGLGSCI